MKHGIVGLIAMHADTSQAVLVFVALKFVQKRLNHERSGASIALTVFRNTLVPRVDGRNGFVFELYLMPNSKVASSQGACPWRPPMEHTAAGQPAWRGPPRPRHHPPQWLQRLGYGVRVYHHEERAASANKWKGRDWGAKGRAGKSRPPQSGKVHSRGGAGSKVAGHQRGGQRSTVGVGVREGEEARGQ
ncbi:hypothetical protein DUNSADRAFT_16007 [Dunaliella salina]|uniref:Encoded protein n=1 Tax=Dunaliella salina TaxID=3046 RepID=A0ABQ7G4E6_DUNSA|nr:hypothetical protein DUNSADRAFT_16007 [Dunaliella salina]|eukprot:KAF5829484.1 hypothetical protein DUNSADRAFT_16007 [Dunaliella salina]